MFLGNASKQPNVQRRHLLTILLLIYSMVIGYRNKIGPRCAGCVWDPVQDPGPDPVGSGQSLNYVQDPDLDLQLL